MGKLTCLSLFSGCGGIDLGVEEAGFKLVFASDLEKRCAQTHALNFPEVPFFSGTVADLDAATLKAHLGRTLKGSCDLLVGGPPCPPFSKSRFYRKEKPRAFEDPVGWETFRGYLNTLALVQPRAFIIENVAGLAYGVHKHALDLILTEAERLKYECVWKVLNAADYGVPQIRERCFIVGMRGKRFEFPAPTHAEKPDADLFSRGRAPWRTAGEVLADLDTEENADDEGHFAGGKHHELLRQVPPGENYLHFTQERGHPDPQFKWRSRYWSFLLKLSPTLPSWTIQARRSNNMGPFHWRNRILRIQEIKRLQTFPDTWHLSGTTEQQWRMIGNAVPPHLARHLASAVRKQLTDKMGGD
jgi:DNA (cytosine-5)-methyltransferase 1